jgi:large subunit ribosomal protein L24
MHVRANDLVEVIAGDDAMRGKAHKVLRVLTKENKVIVEGVNRTKKHVKPSKRNPQGGQLSMELPVAVSNVLLFCPSCRRGVRIGRRYADNGAKERYCKKCGNGLGTLSKPRANYAKKTS